MSRKLNPAIFLTLDPVLDQGQLLFGSGSDGYIYEMEVGVTDDGDEINSRYPTGWEDMGIPEKAKRFRELHLHFDQWGGPISVHWSVDHGLATGTMTARVAGKGVWGPPGVWGPIPNSPGVWGPTGIGTRPLELSFPQRAKGHYIQLVFETNDRSAIWNLTGAEILWEPLDMRPEGDL